MRPAVWLSYATGVVMVIPVIALAIGPFVTGNINNHAVNGNTIEHAHRRYGESASAWHRSA